MEKEVSNPMQFPKPKDLNINMAPFLLGEEEETLPEDWRTYIDLIKACKAPFRGLVCYLTVSEGFVHQGSSQRRGGVHTEASKAGPWGGCSSVWMASTVGGSCRVWDFVVPEDRLGLGGSLEHYDLSSTPSRLLNANELTRLSDRTPHEALPMKESGYRQFFRLVGPEIHGWFAQHSTKNPLCPLPSNIPVYEHNKFR